MMSPGGRLRPVMHVVDYGTRNQPSPSLQDSTYFAFYFLIKVNGFNQDNRPFDN